LRKFYNRQAGPFSLSDETSGFAVRWLAAKYWDNLPISSVLRVCCAQCQSVAMVCPQRRRVATLVRDRLRQKTEERQAGVDHPPPVDLAALSTSLSSATGSAALSLPTDTAVLLRQQAEQVFLVLQYHFGTSSAALSEVTVDCCAACASR
jgi:hypothetical protein